MIRTRGSKAAARAIAIDWRWPPESFSTCAAQVGDVDLERVEVQLASSRIRRWSSSRSPSTDRRGSRPRNRLPATSIVSQSDRSW